MFTYLISYDLSKPENSDDYKALIAYIKSFGLWAKPQKSLWIIKSPSTIDVVRTTIRQNMDSNDKLLVLDITGDNWATYNQSKTITDWLQKNV